LALARPITTFGAVLRRNDLTQADVAPSPPVEEEVRHAVEFADQSPDPALDTLFDDVYAGPDAPVDGWSRRNLTPSVPLSAGRAGEDGGAERVEEAHS
jgi:hypothetical protein